MNASPGSFSPVASIRPALGKQWRHADEPVAFSSLLADRWAEAICSYWRIAARKERIDLTAPLCILDLAPAAGNPPWQMIAALLSRTSDDMESLPPFVYVSCTDNVASLALLQSHCSLQQYFRQGRLKVAQWNFDSGVPELPGEPGTLRSMLARNPAVVVAHDAWSRSEQRLFGVHYGTMLLALPKPGDVQSVDWRPIGPDCPARIRGALLRYSGGINSARILIAKGQDLVAFRMVDIAREAGIPVLQNVPLARALMKDAKLDHYIPGELIEPVAEILRDLDALIARMKEEEGDRYGS